MSSRTHQEPGRGRRPAGPLLLLLLAALLLGVPVAMGWLAHQVLQERRSLLLEQQQAQVATTVNRLAALVGERARDVRSDLRVAAALLNQPSPASGNRLHLVRSHLTALNRATRHYLALWWLHRGEVQAQAAGVRSDLPGPPLLEAGLLQQVDAEARAEPGQIVVRAVQVPSPSDYQVLRLLALAPTQAENTLVFLVSMDALFDTLQKRASVPGADLWVVDADGAVLVDPGGGSFREGLLAALTAQPVQGSTLLGELPPLLNLGGAEPPGALLVWRSRVTPPFLWTTAAAVPLVSVTAELRNLGMRLVLLFGLLYLALGAVAAALLWYARRQRHLREQLANQASADRVRDQLIQAEKLATLGQIAAGVAHEIGTPLGVISIRLDQLLARADSDKDRERIGVMKKQIDRITAIIRQLLDYARPREVRQRPVAVREAVAELLSLLEHRLVRDGLHADNAVPATARLLADHNQLQQVLLNLLVNACDASSPGGALRIRWVERAETPELVGVAVEDEGSGVADADRDALFEPFFTTKPRGQGNGLGLTIVKDIVEHHGGRIELQSSPAGSCFTIWLRRASPDARSDPEPGPAEAPRTEERA